MNTITVQLGPLKEVAITFSKLGGEEKSGILVGKKTDSTIAVAYIYRTDNIKSSPVEFEAEPWQIVQAHVSAEKYGLEVVGIFHTHPSCPASPSNLDVEGMRRWPYIWVIACSKEIRGWVLEEGRIREVKVD